MTTEQRHAHLQGLSRKENNTAHRETENHVSFHNVTQLIRDPIIVLSIQLTLVQVKMMTHVEMTQTRSHGCLS